MKANNDTKTFRLVDGKFSSSKWWLWELWVYLILFIATALFHWLGWL